MLTEDQIEAICARHAAVIGMSGSGKTYTEKGWVEFLLTRHRHTVIIDPLGAWWGLRSSMSGRGKGFKIPIFGGEHGDVEIGVWDGPAVADIVLKQTVSCIIDLSGFRTGSDQRMFMEGFIGALRGKPKGVLNLIVDEADEFAPETVADRMGYRLKEDMVWIAKRGRLSGFVLHALTQRPADIAKSVLTQCQTLVVHQLIAPQDQKPAELWLKGNGDKETMTAVMSSLAGLETGERWVYSPKASILARGHSPAIATFDSSRTPEPGETLVEAKTLAQIDVSAIKGALAKPEAKDPEDAPAGPDSNEVAILHDRIVDLEQERDQREEFHGTQRTAIREALVEFSAQLNAMGTQILEAIVMVDEWSAKMGVASIPRLDIRQPPPPPPPPPMRDLRENRVPPRGAAVTMPTTTSPAALGVAQSLSKKARDFIDMLDRLNPASVTWAQLAVLVGGKARGGTFSAAVKQARESGLVREFGDRVCSAQPARVGLMRSEAVALWIGVLREISRTAAAMLEQMVAMDRPMTKDEIAESVGIVARGGNFGAQFGHLRNNGLIEPAGEGVFQVAAKLPGER